MSKSQNPDIPAPTQAIEIDRAIQDIMLALETNLDWLSHNYARAYRHKDIRGGKTADSRGLRLYYPLLYISNGDYMPLTADNDRKGQCFFIVFEEKIDDYEKDQYNFLSYDVGIVFNANSSLINKDLANNEDFTQILIAGVRDVLTRKISGKPFNVEIKNIKRLFKDIYKEFTLDEEKHNLKLPMTAFRINCKITMREECGLPLYNPATAILQNISQTEILGILLPTLDFSDPVVFNSLSAKQKNDISVQLP